MRRILNVVKVHRWFALSTVASVVSIKCGRSTYACPNNKVCLVPRRPRIRFWRIISSNQLGLILASRILCLAESKTSSATHALHCPNFLDRLLKSTKVENIIDRWEWRYILFLPRSIIRDIILLKLLRDMIWCRPVRSAITRKRVKSNPLHYFESTYYFQAKSRERQNIGTRMSTK